MLTKQPKSSLFDLNIDMFAGCGERGCRDGNLAVKLDSGEHENGARYVDLKGTRRSPRSDRDHKVFLV